MLLSPFSSILCFRFRLPVGDEGLRVCVGTVWLRFSLLRFSRSKPLLRRRSFYSVLFPSTLSTVASAAFLRFSTLSPLFTCRSTRLGTICEQSSQRFASLFLPVCTRFFRSFLLLSRPSLSLSPSLIYLFIYLLFFFLAFLLFFPIA